jgi:hypothetical protein
MTQLEKDIEKKLHDMVEDRHGGRCLKWVCPGWTGVPDRILLLPGGLIMFVETKRPKGGRYSAMQDKWRDWITALGCHYYRIKNMEELAVFELILLDTIGRSKT